MGSQESKREMIESNSECEIEETVEKSKLKEHSVEHTDDEPKQTLFGNNLEGVIGHTVKESKQEVIVSNSKGTVGHTVEDSKQEVIVSNSEDVVGPNVEKSKQDVIESNSEDDREYNIEESKQKLIQSNPEDARVNTVEESEQEVIVSNSKGVLQGHTVEDSKQEVKKCNPEDAKENAVEELEEVVVSNSEDATVEESNQEVIKSNPEDAKENTVEESEKKVVVSNSDGAVGPTFEESIQKENESNLEDAKVNTVEESKENVIKSNFEGAVGHTVEQLNTVVIDSTESIRLISESNPNVQNELNYQGTYSKLKCMMQCIDSEACSAIRPNSELCSGNNGTVGKQIVFNNFVNEIDQKSSPVIDVSVKPKEIKIENIVPVNKEMRLHMDKRDIIIENDTNSVSKSLSDKKFSKKNICSNTDLSLLSADLNSLQKLCVPDNIKVDFKSTDGFADNSHSFEWSVDLAFGYLSKISSVLEEIKLSTTNIHLDDLNYLQNTTSCIISQIKGEDIHQNGASNTEINQKDNMLSKHDITNLQCLSEKYRCLTIQTTTTFYCTLCNIYIYDALKSNEYSGIESHMKSDSHTQKENDKTQIYHSECSQDNLVTASDSFLSQECKNQKDFLKMESEALKKENTLCEKYFSSFEIDTDNFEKETCKSSHGVDLMPLQNDTNSLENSILTDNLKKSKQNSENSDKGNKKNYSGKTDAIETHETFLEQILDSENSDKGNKKNYSGKTDAIETHETFLEQILDLYCSQEKVLQNHESVPRRGFYCFLCNLYNFYSSEIKGHDKKHIKQKKKVDCKVFVCDTCNVELYGSNSFVVRIHNQSPSHIKMEKEFLKRNNSGEELFASLGNVPDGVSTHDLSGNNKLLVPPTKEESSCQANSLEINNITEGDKIESSNLVKNEDSGNLTASTSNENLNIRKTSRLYNVINSDQYHKDLMRYVAKAYLLQKSQRLQLPSVIAFFCETCKTTMTKISEWDEHVNAEVLSDQTGSLALYTCDVCRITFLSSGDYFKNHLQSISHHAIICKTKPNETLKVEQKEDSESDDESSSSSDDTDKDGPNKEGNKKEVPKKDKIKLKNKCLGLIVKGFPADTKPKAFYKVFHSMGITVNYVQMNYKKKADCALVLLLNATDLETILKRKEPLMIDGVAVTTTKCMSKKKDKFEISASLSKLFYSPAVLMGVIDKLIYRYSSIAKEEMLRTNQLLSDIEKILPGIKVYPFGSRMYGTTSGSSDLDVFADFDGTSYYDSSLFENSNREERNIKVITNEFKRCNKFTDIFPIFARVPIVRLVHRATGLACDISCKNGLSVENTLLTKCYLESDPRVAWLVTAVKYWANINKLKDSTKFTSFALTWMVLYFLMQLKDPVVFPVESLRKLKYEPKPMITGWDCQFCSDVKLYPKTKNTQLVLELLHDFFVFYATLDHENQVLCPIIGSAIPVDKFRKLELPACFQTYVRKFRKTHEHILYGKPLCLQDPFDLGHNLTKSVKIDCLNFFKQLCIKSARLCEEW